MDCVDTVGAAMCVVCPLPSAGERHSSEERKGQTGQNLLFYLIFQSFVLSEKD